MENKSFDSKNRGFELVNFCELDKFATKSYCAIYDESPDKNLGDITKVNADNMNYFNMICGGSPCQDFSIAGKQSGSRWVCRKCGYEYNPLTVHFDQRDRCPKCSNGSLDKTRSSLLVEWLRLIRANKPKWAIYENVKNIVGKKFKQTFQMFIDELNEYGYNTYYKVLNAKDYEIPQNRERVYVIIIRKDIDNGLFKFPEPIESDVRMSDVLENSVDEKYYINTPRAKELIEELVLSGKLENETSHTVRGGGEEAWM